MKYPYPLLHLMEMLRKLPGVGTKSAERFAFQLLQWDHKHLNEMAEAIKGIGKNLRYCASCGCLIGPESCHFCEERASASVMCITATAKDVFAIESTGAFKGLYHVLGGLLSPIDGRTPECLKLDALKARLHQHPVKEILIALDSTLEGDATSLYIKQELSFFSGSISRLAFGLPLGSSLDYIDGGTLTKALIGRSSF